MTEIPADKLRNEGRVEGRIQGMVEGQLDMRKKAILRLLSSRIDEISERRRSQVMEAGLDDFDVWFDRALITGDVDAVFGGAAEG